MTRSVLVCAATLAIVPALVGSRPPALFLEGRVLTSGARLYVEGATVSLVVSGWSRTTDSTGYFSFDELDILRPDTLVVSHPSYATARLPLGDPDDGRRSITIRLLRTPVSVDETGDREPWERRR